MSLNQRAAKAAKPGDTLWDDDVKGLHLRVFPNRSVFYLKYRTRDTQVQRKPKLGPLGVLTIDEARTRARSILAEVANGGDPKADWDAKGDAASVADLAKRYLRDHAPKRKSSKEMHRMWNVYVKDQPIAKIKVADVTHEDVTALHNRYADTPNQSNRVLQMLSAMFGKAEVWRDDTGRVMRATGSNPCQHVERFKERKRKRYMTPAEMAKVIAEINRQEKLTTRNKFGVAFIKLLILTGARSNEIRIARWDWIRDNHIEFPEGTTKTEGSAEAGEHRVFLSAAAKEVLDGLPKTSGTLTGIKSPKNLWETIRTNCGCPDLRLHDLRHSFASVAKSAGMSLDEIGELLNHRSRATTLRYAHLFTERAVESVNAIDAAQQRAIELGKQQQKA